MSLEKLASRYEKLKVQLSEQYYKQEAGLPYDRGLMKKCARAAWKLDPDLYLEEQFSLSFL